jgi:hypothetical protein
VPVQERMHERAISLWRRVPMQRTDQHDECNFLMDVAYRCKNGSRRMQYCHIFHCSRCPDRARTASWAAAPNFGPNATEVLNGALVHIEQSLWFRINAALADTDGVVDLSGGGPVAHHGVEHDQCVAAGLLGH